MSVETNFFENLEADMQDPEHQAWAAAATIIDPETGQHADVFVHRRGLSEHILRTRSAPAFARVCRAHGCEDHEPLATPPAQTNLKDWSLAALRVAEYLVRNSECGGEMDPLANVASVFAATGLPAADIELGVLHLSEAGLVKCLIGVIIECFWPETGLFVEFDQHFLAFDSGRDAVAVAHWLISQKIMGQRIAGISVAEVARHFTDWPARRLNSALNYLDNARLIRPLKAADSRPWTMTALYVTDRTRRFARDQR